MIGLADCDSFYASCEKLFRPDLRGRPVVVLSNNDGCIVALSREAKRLGLERGAPYFRARRLIEATGTAVFSSNYTLYQDISDRVVRILGAYARDIEPYSIDESFFSPLPTRDLGLYAMRLHNSLRRLTGLGISVGLARTKTLSKIACRIAKRGEGWRYLDPASEEEALRATPVGEVWGIGRRSEARLLRFGIGTAWDLAGAGDAWIRRNLTIRGLRTAMELRGVPAIGPEDPERRSFFSGISFDEPRTTFDALQQTVVCHCQALARKLAERSLLAGVVSVQILTSRFKDGFYLGEARASAPRPTNYAPALAQAATEALREAFRPGLEYKASRVGVWGLSPAGWTEPALFEGEAERARAAKEARLASLPGLCRLSSGMVEKTGLCRRELLSPMYTTRWADLPAVY